MAYPISDVTRRVVYTGSAGVGPYSFTFEVLANTDIQVYKNTTLLTLTTNYTVTINANGTGSVTLVVAATGADTITIVGDRAIQRATDFVTGGDLFANTLNDEFDSLVIFAQQVDEKADRGLKAPVTDPTDVNMVLPVKATRLGTVLAFNATTGNPEAGPSIASVTTVAAQSANINTVATNIASVNTVAGNNTNVTTVAGVSGAVTTVAGISANVTSVAGNSSNINTVAGNNANVTAVGTISSNVTTVAGISANVTTVAGISSNVTTVAGVSAAVTTNATNIASINTNATNIVAIQNASTNATNAAASAVSAGNAQTAAEAARDATLSAYDNFDDRYLGSKTSNPTVDNDGNALVAGSLYFNSVSGSMQVYTGSAWVAAYVSGSGYLASANNLSDVASTSSARTNLGLAIGTNVQAYDANLTAIAALTPTADNFIVGNGTAWTLETPAQARTSLGLGTAAVVADSTLVHTSGNETIAGTKTFSSDASISGLTVGKGGGAVSTNTAVGASALSSNSAGTRNTAVGSTAASGVTGSRIVAIGDNVLATSTSGNDNVAIGDYTMRAYTGSSSTAVGAQAMANGTSNSGDNNTAIGSGALNANAGGASNTAVGASALTANTTGIENTAVGYQALNANTTASYNTSVGRNSLYLTTTGTHNTCIGHNSGYNISTGTKNTILGRYDGNQGGLDIRTASNYIVLSDGDGNPRAWIGAGNNNDLFRVGTNDTSTPGFMHQIAYSQTSRAVLGITNLVSGANPSGLGISYPNSGNTSGTDTYLSCSNNAGSRAYIKNDGGLANYSANNQNLSDRREKEDFAEAGNYLDKICAIPVQTFRYIERDVNDTAFTLGVVAQDVQAVAPELVTESNWGLKEDPRMRLSVYQTDLQFALMKSIQELKTIVDAQAAEITALKAK